MSEERKRILQMFAEGKITLEECDELLESLQQRQAELAERTKESEEVARAPAERRRRKGLWVIWVLVSLIGALFLGNLMLVFARSAGISAGETPPVPSVLWPLLIVPLIIISLVAGFHVWMLLDCLLRNRGEFRTSITEKHDKLVWLLLILFVPVVGAIAYYIAVGRYPRQSLPQRSGM